MEMTMDKSAAPKWRKTVLAAGVGAATGFLATLAFMSIVDSGAVGEIGTSREIAALVGLVYVVTALAVGVGVLNPRIGARFLNVEDAGELEEMRRMLSLSGLSSAGIGAALILLALAQPLGVVPESIAFAGALVLLVLAAWLSFRARAVVDELIVSLSREAAATAFYLLALVGGGWSILAHLDFAAPPAPLDWLTMFAGLLLVATIGVCSARGMLKPR